MLDSKLHGGHPRARVMLSVPPGQRFSCRRCGRCCKGWNVMVEPAERERLLAVDWARISPRLRGAALSEEVRPPDQTEPAISTAHVGERCVFLEDDNLCLIHRVLGEQAKPLTCRRFPLVITLVGDTALVGADYACPTMVRSEGVPLQIDEEIVTAWLGRAESGPTSPGRGTAEQEVRLSPGVRMDWDGYLVLEAELAGIMGMDVGSPAFRWAACRQILADLAAWGLQKRWLRRDDVRSWLGGQDRKTLWPEPAEEDRLLPRIEEVAHLMGATETPHSPATGLGSAAIGYSMAVVEGSGDLFVPSLGAWVDLEELGRVERWPSRPELGDLLSRFAMNYLHRGSMLGSPSLRDGWDFLGKCLTLVGWYAAASAVLAGRRSVEMDDLVAGIVAVERGYVP